MADVEKLTESSLSKLYSEWKASKKVEKLINDYFSNKKQNYEAKKIVERFLLSKEQINVTDGLLMARKKAEEELKEKGLVPLKESLFMGKVLTLLTPEKGSLDPKGVSSINVDKGLITYKVENDMTFSRNVPPERLKVLMERSGKDIDSITAIAMSYSSMLPGGQQWNIPFAVYKIINETYGTRLEGFASPFNSQMLMLGGSFCSLFKVDSAVGSMGDFFSTVDVGMDMMVNPPYVPDIMERAVTKCNNILKGASNLSIATRFFMTFPYWTDANFIQVMEKSPFLRFKMVLKGGTYYYEDEGKRIKAPFDSVFYVISYGYPYLPYEDVILDPFSMKPTKYSLDDSGYVQIVFDRN